MHTLMPILMVLEGLNLSKSTRASSSLVSTHNSKKELPAIRTKIPMDLLVDNETHLDGIFNLIRLVRNQSGHPSGVFPDQAIVGANLQAFSFYAVRVNAFEQYFASNPL